MLQSVVTLKTLYPPSRQIPAPIHTTRAEIGPSPRAEAGASRWSPAPPPAPRALLFFQCLGGFSRLTALGFSFVLFHQAVHFGLSAPVVHTAQSFNHFFVC